MTGSKSSKRLDLQGIRGLAILVVLGFHFYPDQFPNGYLGVDQFFVLSGFLMCMLLKRSENEAACTLISLFYSKRFKRILPLYLILIFISMIALYSFFPDTAIETNQESAVQALLFVSNRPQTEEEDYFKMLSTAIDIFTHTWSLSVEIQFYFLVPLLFLLGSRFSDQKFQYGYYGFTGLISLIFFFISPDTVAFNSVFARIWQFLIGMMVYLANGQNQLPKYKLLDCESAEKNLIIADNFGQNKMEDCQPLLQSHPEATDPTVKSSEKSNCPIKSFSIVLLIFLISLTAYPSVLPANFVRPLVTFGTGFLMLISDSNAILSNRLLTYIGDISYSLYLIHWPIYAYWKLTCNGDQKLLSLVLISSIILAVIIFETYEKWYLTLSSTNIGVLCVVLFLLNVLVINKENIPIFQKQEKSFNSNITLDGLDASEMNHVWNRDDKKGLYISTCEYSKPELAPFGWCRHKNLTKTGPYKLLIIGNSMAANHARLFYEECGYKAKSILQGSYRSCEPLYPTIDQNRGCNKKIKEFEENVENEKPDYAFFITRYFTIGEPFPPNVTTFDKDPIYQIMKEKMQKYIRSIKRKLYILDAIPRINMNVIEKIGDLVKDNTDPTVIDNLLVFPDKYLMARRRNAQLIKDCKGKCELIDYIPSFYNSTSRTFRYFDEKGFSYWTTTEHFSPHGIEHIRNVWTGICREL